MGVPAQVVHQPGWRLFPKSNLVGYFLLLTMVFVFCAWGKSHAQVTAITGDGTMGTNVPTGCNVCNITGGTRPGNGPNLFHSFDKFDVGPTGVANFLNDSGLPTSNILSRVTGGSPSNILGTIKTTEGFGNANLFLMNPYGIVFGENATLDVGGAAYFTTADYLRLADGAQFTAMPGAPDALLTVAPVAAFGFFGTNPGGTISVDGSTLSVKEGQTLSLVGGNITIGNSALKAPGGQIAIASVASPGEVLADTFAGAPNVNGESFTTMGNIVLSDGAKLNVSGDPAGGDAAGTVIIRGGQLMMTNATISADTGNSDGAATAVSLQLTGDLGIKTDLDPAISAQSLGDGNAGEVQIESENMSVLVSSPAPLSVIASEASGTGKAGNVSITTGTLEFRSDAEGFLPNFIDSGTGSDGHGGNITITADSFSMEIGQLLTGSNRAFDVPPLGPSGNVSISADTLAFNGAQISTETFFSKGGNVTIVGKDILLENSPIFTNGPVQSGGISINADSLVIRSSRLESIIQGLPLGLIDDNPAPPAGISIHANVVELKEGSQLITSTQGDSDAGPIVVNATDYLGILGNLLEIRPSGIFSNALGSTGQGNSGSISITTNFLEMTGGGVINTATQGSGVGGKVNIDAKTISIGGQQEVAPTEPELGLGGVLASGIFTSTVGDGTFCSGLCGDAGNISIKTGSLNLSDGGKINSGTMSTGKGGIISLKASEAISIAGTLDDGITPGGVFSQTTGTDPGAGAGGTITLAAGQNLTLSDGAKVSASSEGPGHAGAINIDVTAGSFAIAKGGVVDSGTSGTGAGGPITVHAADNITIAGTSTDGMPSRVLSQTTGTDLHAGVGGNISLSSEQNLTLSDGALISASSSGPANAGNINITAHDTILIDKATVNAEALQASGGNITLTAHDTIQLVDSTIASSVQGDAKTVGGNITLDPDFIIGQNSQILAQALAGQGGNITLMANKAVLLDSFTTAHLDASSETGISGSVTIQSPIQNLSSTITPLPQNTLPVTALYGSKCVAGVGGHFSTFVDSKADSLTPTPGTFLASPLLQPSVQAKADNSDNQKTPVVLTASIAPLVFGHAGESTTTCP